MSKQKKLRNVKQQLDYLNNIYKQGNISCFELNEAIRFIDEQIQKEVTESLIRRYMRIHSMTRKRAKAYIEKNHEKAY